ncbi:MAG: metal-binding protein [Blastocatellia bacterium]|nr:metal-binding protein [Blastocatellia bacterium]MCS7158528.1 metal-binding protein [Blastocatellia bacterium]MDW8169347.1 metal-binding protein [Acidobacteriota bacterium]MDW8257724.1 metal-binding protein [Acidobacteriota bacterium]
MPRAKTHDAITLALALPTFLLTHALTASRDLAWLVTLATLFSGFMFNPDLDVQSKPYARWGPLRFLWWPYQVLIRHRSRLSHGLLLGTFVRTVYLSIMLALLGAAGILFWHALQEQPGASESLRQAWISVKRWLLSVERRYWLALFFGLWWGAAAHTLADWLWSLWTQTKRLL